LKLPVTELQCRVWFYFKFTH